MTEGELAIWREKSEQLRQFVLRMDQGPERAAIAFAAGAMLGLANRLKACEEFPRPQVIGTGGDGPNPRTATIARKIYLTEGFVTHLERMRERHRLDNSQAGPDFANDIDVLFAALGIP